MKNIQNILTDSRCSKVLSSLLTLSMALSIGLSVGCSGDTFQKYKLDRIVEDNSPEPDTTAPSISAVKVSAYNKIEVTFDQEVDSATALNPANYHIQGINRVQVLSSPAPELSSDAKTVTLNLTQGYLNGMQHGKEYTILVQRVKDLNQNAILTDFSTFTGRGQVYASVSFNGKEMASESPWPAINTASPALTIGGDGVVSYMYSFDDSPWCSEINLSTNNTILLSSLSEGFHTLKVVGKNSDGKWQDANEATAVSFTIDTKAPTAVLNKVPLASTSSTNCAITVGGEGVTGYIYRINSESWSGTIPVTTSITRKNLIAGTYTVSVRGCDDAGNIQTGSTDYSWVIIENQPVAALSGLPTKSTRMTSIGVTVSGGDVNYYTYTLNGTESGLCNVSDPITVSGLREGTYTLTVTGQKTSDPMTAGPAITYSWTVDRTAPVCTISNTPLTPTNSQSTHIFVSSSAGDVVSYQYYLTTGTRKGELCGPFDVSVPIDLSGLPENDYTLQVMGIDAAGNIQGETASTQYSWSVDISAPVTVLGGLPATLTNVNSFSVSVGSASNDIVAYKYMLNDGSGNSEWSSEIDASVRIERTAMADGTYTLCVIAKDQAGNWQSMQADTEYTWTIDTAPPVALLGNKPAQVTSGREAHFYVYGTGVVSFQYRLDGGAWSQLQSRINTQGMVTSIDCTGLAEGAHTIEVIGVDLAGNRQSESASGVTSYTWTINLSLPSAVLSGTPAIYTNLTSISVTVSGCENYKYMLDNGSWTGPFPASDPISVTGLSEGDHKLSVIGQNTIGANIIWQDTLVATTHSWTVDLAAPTATITGINPMQEKWTSAASILVGTDSASFTIGGNGVYSYKIAHLTGADPEGYPDEANYSAETVLTADPATHVRSYSNLTNGTHRLYVIARDEAGNWQNLSEATRYIWTINTYPPTAGLPAIASPTQSKDLIIYVTGASDVTSYSYSLDGGSWTAETALSMPISLAGLADGTHHLSVIAKNTLGIWQDVSKATQANDGNGWIVDTTAPDLSSFSFVFESLPANPTTATTATGIKVKAVMDSETALPSVTAVKYRLVSGGVEGAWSAELPVNESTLIATLPTIPSTGTLSPNEYAIDVIGRDKLGNWTASYNRSSSWKVVSGADLPFAVIGTGSLKNPSKDTAPSFTISGTNIIQYKYALGVYDSLQGKIVPGTFSSWRAVSVPLDLTFAADGSKDGTQILYVCGSKSTVIPPTSAEPALTQPESLATTVSWVLDTQAPTVVLTGLPDATTTSTSISVKVGGTGVVSYQYRIDSTSEDDWRPLVGANHVDRTVDYPITQTLSAGAHTLYVKGFDQAGNQSDIKTWSWTITEPDLVAPAVTARGTYSTGYLNFDWIYPDGTKSVYIQISASSDFSSRVAEVLLGCVGTYSYLPIDSNIDAYYARVWVSRSASPTAGWDSVNNRPSDATFMGSGTGSAAIQVVGHIKGRIMDPTTSSAVAAARVRIYDQKNDKYLDAYADSDSTGSFLLSNIPIRTMTGNTPYYLTVTKTGYCTSRKNNVTVARGEITNVGIIYTMDTSGKSSGMISGTVCDANTAQTLSADIKVIDGVGATVTTATSESAFGTFTTASCSPGIYSVKISCAGYYDLIKDNVVVNGDKNIGRQAICSVLTEPQVRVIYLWDAYPSDPDMYMTGPTMVTQSDYAPANRFLIWSGAKSFNERDGAYYDTDIQNHGDWYGEHSTASLVQDGVTGYGPEAINLYRCDGVQYAKGTYTFTVHRFAYNPRYANATTSAFKLTSTVTSGSATVTGTVPTTYDLTGTNRVKCTVANGSNVLTPSTAMGDDAYARYNFSVTGTGIPAGASLIWYDRSNASTNPFQISKSATASGTDVSIALTNRIEAYNIYKGVPVTGSGIPAGTTVVSVSNTGGGGYSIVLSNAATASGNNQLTFTPGWGNMTGLMRVYDSGGMVQEINFDAAQLLNDNDCWKALKINIQGNMRSKRKITAVNQFGQYSLGASTGGGSNGITKKDADW